MIIIIIIMIISPNGVIHLFNLMAFWYKNWELETEYIYDFGCSH